MASSVVLRRNGTKMKKADSPNSTYSIIATGWEVHKARRRKDSFLEWTEERRLTEEEEDGKEKNKTTTVWLFETGVKTVAL